MAISGPRKAAVFATVLLVISLDVCATQSNIDAENCGSTARPYNGSFILPAGAIQSTVLQYAMDTAVNRAVFYSLIYNWTTYGLMEAYRDPEGFMREYKRQPGLNYIYMSTAANVHAAPAGVEASGLFYDANSSYPNWLADVPFNGTLNLFGIRADEHIIKDFGFTPESNYRDSSIYPQNEFYLALRNSNQVSQRKYYEMRRYGPMGLENEKNIGINKISGEAGYFTSPYLDCRQANAWVLDAVSMVTERMVRNTPWTSLQRMKSTAASTVSVALEALQGLDPSTGLTTDRAPVLPSRRAQGLSKLKEQNPNQCGNLIRPNPPVYLPQEFWNAQDLALTLEAQGRAGLRLSHFLSNFMQNNDFEDNDRNEITRQQAYDNWYRSGYQGDPPTFDSPMIEVLIDQDLSYKQLASEVFATLVSGDKIRSVGIFLDRGVFSGRADPVSAFAWKGADDTVGNVVDVFDDGDDFTTEDWFIQAKQSYAQISGTNSKSFSTFREVRAYRSSAPRTVPEPVTYIATSYDQGTWLTPKFICSWTQAGWIASYVSPILVRGYPGLGPVFGGVVKVDAAFTADNISPN